MSTPARPSTPVAQTASSVPQTGTWRHPKMDEIVRRQNASSFTDRNVRNILYNSGGILTAFFVARALWESFPSFFADGKSFQPYAGYGYHALQFMFIYNIIIACLPLFRTTDDMSDIPLTPAQRKLLGLPPSSAPPTPGSQYITPPRYARTPTPLSGSPAAKGVYSNSPLAGKGSPMSGSVNGSPFSPGASPLLQKAMGGNSNGNRRHSYGSPSPLGPTGSRFGGPEAPGTPSPASKGSGIGLNSKWLYDKGRRNSGSARLYT
ncbi:uncharacterized protein PAC_06233 [Phialocephala subalpina]|uniref:Nuclear pore complex component n=1 Tax=Phialocephala subalpina TaxID=576137 RepID=A0A1L7WU83_9HELO|nr:uncharacterized protein PAC_06233 [Phialocephala subalpina]